MTLWAVSTREGVGNRSDLPVSSGESLRFVRKWEMKPIPLVLCLLACVSSWTFADWAPVERPHF